MISILLMVSLFDAQPTATDCTQIVGPQAELNECFYRHYQQADRQLNLQWKKTTEAARRLDADMRGMRKPSFGRLLNGQRAWLRYREETCGWVHDSFGGSIAPVNYYSCMADVTRTRIAELKLLAVDPNSGEPL